MKRKPSKIVEGVKSKSIGLLSSSIHKRMNVVNIFLICMACNFGFKPWGSHLCSTKGSYSIPCTSCSWNEASFAEQRFWPHRRHQDWAALIWRKADWNKHFQCSKVFLAFAGHRTPFSSINHCSLLKLGSRPSFVPCDCNYMDRFKVGVGLDREGSLCSPAEATINTSIQVVFCPKYLWIEF